MGKRDLEKCKDCIYGNEDVQIKNGSIDILCLSIVTCRESDQFKSKPHKDQVDAVAMGFNSEALAETGKALHEKFLDMFTSIRVIPDDQYKGNQYGVHVSPEIFQELKKRQ